MFTGIIEETGTVHTVRQHPDGRTITVHCHNVLNDLAVDNSIALDGACQTVTDCSREGFSVFAMTETLKKTTLGYLKKGDPINLERALRADARLGGHLVQGHVDCTAVVDRIVPRTNTCLLSFRLPDQWAKLTVLHGSIAVNGVSLTIARKAGVLITVSVIPYTLKATTLGGVKPGAPVNIETDIIGKYLHAFAAKEKA